MIRPLYHKRKPDRITIFMLVCLVIILLSCNVLKGKRSMTASVDSVSRHSTAVIDTGTGGQVSKNTTKSTDEWWRTTVQYPPRDTIHNVTNVYPSTVVYEGGKGTKEVQQVDSSWFHNAMSLLQASQDSVSRLMREQTKDKETRPSVWLFVGILVAVLVCWKLLGTGWKWLTAKYHIFTPKT